MFPQISLTDDVHTVEHRIRDIEACPLPPNVFSILEDAARECPTHTALNFFEDGVSFTYSELVADVLALARGLSAAGVKSGDKIVVMLPNCDDFPRMWLAIGRLGAVMIPTNIAYTPRELSFIAANGEARWVCIHKECLPVFDALADEQRAPYENGHLIISGVDDGATDALTVSGLIERGRSGDIELPALASITLDTLLNIQYTSGTTGMPKGCMLTHRYWVTAGLVNAFRDGRRYRNILASVPFFYMDPQWLMLMTSYQRATLHVARRQSSSRFMSWVRGYNINFALFPEVVLKNPPDPLDNVNEIVRVNIYGLAKDMHSQLEQRFGFRAREAYGMTEIGSGMFVPLEATHMVGTGVCGRPSPFRQARIVDSAGNELADDAEGELQIRGPGIMLGYYANAEATRNAFQDGWFRTGDLARRNAEGFYTLVGRIKDMIRRAGENVAANEVEAVLRGIPQIFEVAAVAEPDALRGEEVKIFVALGEGVGEDDLPPKDILAFASRHLAKFKVPRYVTYVPAIPQTASGKMAKHILLGDKAYGELPTYDATTDGWR